jgi:hypothetical protein
LIPNGPEGWHLLDDDHVCLLSEEQMLPYRKYVVGGIYEKINPPGWSQDPTTTREPISKPISEPAPKPTPDPS